MRACAAVPWPVVALGLAFVLSACVRNERWPYAGYERHPYPARPYAPRPIEPAPDTAARVVTRPAPESSASTLSPEEKERLFQQFQDMESRRRQTVTTEEATP